MLFFYLGHTYAVNSECTLTQFYHFIEIFSRILFVQYFHNVWLGRMPINTDRIATGTVGVKASVIMDRRLTGTLSGA